MGIGGHILGPRKLRQLSERTGLRLTRAYRRNQECVGITVETTCRHWQIDHETGEYREIPDPVHWSSCPQRTEPRLGESLDKPLTCVHHSHNDSGRAAPEIEAGWRSR